MITTAIAPRHSCLPSFLLVLVVLCAQLAAVLVQGQVTPALVVSLPFGARGLTVDASGASIYIGGYQYLIVLSRASNGSYAISRTANTPSYFPYGLVLSSDTSTLYVTDYYYNTVYRLNASTGAVLARTTVGQPWGAVLDASGNLLVSQYTRAAIARINTASGQLTLNYTRSLPVAGSDALEGVAIDGAGSVYVCDYSSNVVLKLSSDLATLLANISLPSSPLNGPTGVAVHPITGDVYIADQNNHRVVHLSPNLSYVGSLVFPTALGPVNPFLVALDLAGRLYVTESSDRMFIFNSTLTATSASSSTGGGAAPGASSTAGASSSVSAPTAVPSSSSIGVAGASVSFNFTASPSLLVAAPWSGRVGARAVQQSLTTNAYLPAVYMIGGTSVLADAFWQSLDGGVTWSPLGSNTTLSAIPTLQGSAVAVLSNNELVIYGGVLVNGTAINTVVSSNSSFTTIPIQYNAPFSPRYNHAYTTLPGTNTTIFCAGITSIPTSTKDCWRATRPELGALTWDQQTANGSFPSGLSNAALISLYDVNSTLLLCGGAVVSGSSSTALSMCWVSSSLGVLWSLGITAAWGARSGLTATSDLNGWAYVYGGQSSAIGSYYYDLWLSTDKAASWSLITTSGLDIQQGCLALYYTQRFVNGVLVTEPQLTIYSGYQPSIGGLVQGSYFIPVVITGVSSSTAVSITTPPLVPFQLTLSLVVSQCQFTLNVAGTLTGFGVSSANPNAALSATLIASLVGSVLGVPASAVQVCVHVTYAYLSTQRGEVYLYSGSINSSDVTSIVANITAATGTVLLSTPTVANITSIPGLVGPQNGSLCIMMYGLPGTIDYPWSLATSVHFVYDPTYVKTSQGTAVSINSGTGTRSFTNRFGVSSTTTLNLFSSSTNLLFLGSSNPVDSTGLIWNLSLPVQLPGGGSSRLSSTITVYNSGGVFIEGTSSRVDGTGEAFLSSVPGFINTVISASNINALAVLYPTCQAPITFTNGLSQPTQPSASNGATHFFYSYVISDGSTYSVQTSLSITATSAFATTQDSLGNPYQSVSNITGTRVYTFLPTGAVLTSRVTFASVQSFYYPYALLASSPGVYTSNTAPYLDGAGLTFSVTPSVPSNGVAIGTAAQYSTVTVGIVSYNNTVTQLNEANFVNKPLMALQQQSYALV